MVKSVIRSIAPEVTVVDITHEIPPYDVRAGALTLARSVQYLCPGVVLAVVDPGVGTDRRAVAVEVGDGAVRPRRARQRPAGLGGRRWSAAPPRAVELTNPEYQLAAPGPTFAGRDVFAPAAAHLCAGVPLEALGPPIDPADAGPRPRAPAAGRGGRHRGRGPVGRPLRQLPAQRRPRPDRARGATGCRLRWTGPPRDPDGAAGASLRRAGQRAGRPGRGHLRAAGGGHEPRLGRRRAADRRRRRAGPRAARRRGRRGGEESGGNGARVGISSPVRLQPRPPAGP